MSTRMNDKWQRSRVQKLARQREYERAQVQAALDFTPIPPEVPVGSLRERFLTPQSARHERDMLYGPKK